MFPENYLPLLEYLAPVIRSVLHRIARWRTPSNWNRSDWANEERSVVNLAVCHIIFEKTANAEALPQAVYFYALSRALTRYRQECLYSRRFLPFAQSSRSDDAEDSAARGSFPESLSTDINSSSQDLLAAIESLSEPESQLIQQLFWQEHTQTEIAQSLRISQRAISERRRRALDNLRSALSEKGFASTSCVSTHRKRRRKNIFRKMHVEVLKNDSQSNIDNRGPQDERNGCEAVGI